TWQRGFKDSSVDFSKQRFSSRKSCDIGNRQIYLAWLYMTLNRVYISSATLHYSFFDRYSARARSKLDKIEQVNLSCYSDYVSKYVEYWNKQDDCTEKTPVY